ncbi:aldo/keto reductase [Streptomyces sp. NPDC058691]|uniref:aldo/keto reductase n=1 Tax=Streptomyces sp. NPDC058691 TaxID=3346601 RepID=UPI0036526890
MRRNTLGRSGVPVTAVGFGAAAIGNLFTLVTDDAAAQAVDAAWEAGIRYFDTAPHYGLGLSERRLGAALRDRPREQYTVSTKVGRLLEPLGDGSPAGDDLNNGFAVPATHHRVWDFSADGVRRSIEDSLERLGLDRIDVAFLHDPDAHAEEAFAQGYPALEKLRTEGVVDAIGAGMNQTGMLARFLRDTDVDVVLMAGRYTLLEQEGLAEVLPEAAARGKSVVVGGVFNSGLLIDPQPDARYEYAPAPAPVLARARRLQTVTGRHGVPLRAAAQRFPAAHPAVASVLLGLRSPAEVRDAEAMHKHPLPAALWADLRAEELLGPDVPVPAGDTA